MQICEKLFKRKKYEQLQNSKTHTDEKSFKYQ